MGGGRQFDHVSFDLLIGQKLILFYFELKPLICVMTKALSNRDYCFVLFYFVIIVQTRPLFTKFCVALVGVRKWVTINMGRHVFES